MKQFFSTLGAIALIVMLLGTVAMINQRADRVPTDTKEEQNDPPSASDSATVSQAPPVAGPDIGQDTEADTGSDTGSDTGTEPEPTPTKTFTVKYRCEGYGSCSCPDPLVYTIEFQEGDTWNTLWGRMSANYGDYTPIMDKNCDSPAPDFTSLDGARIQNTDTTITNDTPLVAGTVYVLYAQPTFLYQGRSFHFDEGMNWHDYCSDTGLNVNGFYVDYSTERVLYNDGTDVYYLVRTGGGEVVFTETIGIDAEYAWGGTYNT